jgi:hypothetical protein
MPGSRAVAPEGGGGEGAAMRWGRTGRGEREGGAAGGPA